MLNFFTQSVAFWRDSDGFGVAQTFEFDAALSDQWFSKSWIKGTFAERTEGVRWHASQKLYYMYHFERAIAGEVWWYGETELDVPMQDYGVRALHRSRFKREWLFFGRLGRLALATRNIRRTTQAQMDGWFRN